MKNKAYRFSFLLLVFAIIVFILLSSFSDAYALHDCHGDDCTLCTLSEVFKAFSAISLLVSFSYVIINLLESIREKFFYEISLKKHLLLSLVEKKVKLSD